jgi:hypothetical protein
VPRLLPCGPLVALAVAALILAQACGAGWHQPAQLGPQAFSPRQQVQIWQRGSAVRWHAVTITPNSVTGIPYLMPISCDSCRRSLLRADVDSIRLGNPAAGLWKTVGLIIAVPTIYLAVMCGTHGGCGRD